MTTSNARNPRSDSKLKKLPLETRLEIYQHATEHSYDETLAWLRSERRLKVSRNTLSLFWHWQRLQLQGTQMKEELETLGQLLRQKFPRLSPEKVQEYGEALFRMKAIASEDAAAWNALQKLALDRERLDLQKEEFSAAQKSKLDAGLQALHAELKGKPKALKKWRELKELIHGSTQELS